MQIASAVQMNGGRANLNLNREYLGTAKIGQILPIFHQECVPGDSFRVHIGSFSRFLPLVVPSYVNLTYRTLSVFVPYHQVMDGAESFFANQAMFNRVSNTLPTFTLRNLLTAFANYSDMKQTDASKVKISIDGTVTNLSAKGIYCIKFLNSLGLRFPLTITNTNRTFNALPLLAACHAYNRYLAYSSRVNSSELTYQLENLKRNPSTIINAGILHTLLSSILLTYEESFFSLAWLNPFYSQGETAGSAVATAGYKETVMQPLSNMNGAEYLYSEGVNKSNGDGELNAMQIRLMLRYDDYFRRNNYAGSKDIEQIYSRFGVKIDDYKTRYPYFLNETGQNVSIGDVTSTSDTDSAPIGAYAGKAISNDDAAFTFEAKDYGMLFTFAWFAPRLTYYRGVEKEWLRKEPFDFYTPEMDLGYPSAVNRAQLEGNNLTDATFGYVPLYSEYLYANSQIVGDFENMTGMDTWHFGRNFNLDAAAQSDNFIYMPSGGTPLERIFNAYDPNLIDVDSIYLDVKVDCSAVRPMKDFVGKSGLGEGSLDVPQLGWQAN